MARKKKKETFPTTDPQRLLSGGVRDGGARGHHLVFLFLSLSSRAKFYFLRPLNDMSRRRLARRRRHATFRRMLLRQCRSAAPAGLPRAAAPSLRVESRRKTRRCRG